MTFCKERKRKEFSNADNTCAICGRRRPGELDLHSRSGNHLRRDLDPADGLVVCSALVDGGDSCHSLLHMVENDVVPRALWRGMATQVEGLTKQVVKGELDIQTAQSVLRKRVRWQIS